MAFPLVIISNRTIYYWKTNKQYVLSHIWRPLTAYTGTNVPSVTYYNLRTSDINIEKDKTFHYRPYDIQTRSANHHLRHNIECRLMSHFNDHCQEHKWGNQLSIQTILMQSGSPIEHTDIRNTSNKYIVSSHVRSIRSFFTCLPDGWYTTQTTEHTYSIDKFRMCRIIQVTFIYSPQFKFNWEVDDCMAESVRVMSE